MMGGRWDDGRRGSDGGRWWSEMGGRWMGDE